MADPRWETIEFLDDDTAQPAAQAAPQFTLGDPAEGDSDGGFELVEFLDAESQDQEEIGTLAKYETGQEMTHRELDASVERPRSDWVKAGFSDVAQIMEDLAYAGMKNRELSKRATYEAARVWARSVVPQAVSWWGRYANWDTLVQRPYEAAKALLGSSDEGAIEELERSIQERRRRQLPDLDDTTVRQLLRERQQWQKLRASQLERLAGIQGVSVQAAEQMIRFAEPMIAGEAVGLAAAGLATLGTASAPAAPMAYALGKGITAGVLLTADFVGEAFANMIERGYSKEEAAAIAPVTGYIQARIENSLIGHFFNAKVSRMVPKKAFGRILQVAGLTGMEYLQSLNEEGMQQVVDEVMPDMIDNIVNRSFLDHVPDMLVDIGESYWRGASEAAPVIPFMMIPGVARGASRASRGNVRMPRRGQVGQWLDRVESIQTRGGDMSLREAHHGFRAVGAMQEISDTLSPSEQRLANQVSYIAAEGRDMWQGTKPTRSEVRTRIMAKVDPSRRYMVDRLLDVNDKVADIMVRRGFVDSRDAYYVKVFGGEAASKRTAPVAVTGTDTIAAQAEEASKSRSAIDEALRVARGREDAKATQAEVGQGPVIPEAESLEEQFMAAPGRLPSLGETRKAWRAMVDTIGDEGIGELRAKLNIPAKATKATAIQEIARRSTIKDDPDATFRLKQAKQAMAQVVGADVFPVRKPPTRRSGGFGYKSGTGKTPLIDAVAELGLKIISPRHARQDGGELDGARDLTQRVIGPAFYRTLFADKATGFGIDIVMQNMSSAYPDLVPENMSPDEFWSRIQQEIQAYRDYRASSEANLSEEDREWQYREEQAAERAATEKAILELQVGDEWTADGVRYRIEAEDDEGFDVSIGGEPPVRWSFASAATIVFDKGSFVEGVRVADREEAFPPPVDASADDAIRDAADSTPPPRRHPPLDRLIAQLVDQEKAAVEAQLRSMLGPEVKVLWESRALTTPDGRAAIGSVRGKLVRIVEGTGLEDVAAFHEAVHWAENNLLTVAEAEELMALVPDAERRANGFIAYRQGGDWRATVKGELSWKQAAKKTNFFAGVQDLFEAVTRRATKFFGGSDPAIDKVHELYDRLERGWYARRNAEIAFSSKERVMKRDSNAGYAAAADILRSVGAGRNVLDYGGGLGGDGTVALQADGFNVRTDPEHGGHDAVLLVNVLNHVPEAGIGGTIAAAGDSVAPGGRLWVSARDKASLGILEASGAAKAVEGESAWILTESGQKVRAMTEPQLVAAVRTALGEGWIIVPANVQDGVGVLASRAPQDARFAAPRERPVAHDYAGRVFDAFRKLEAGEVDFAGFMSDIALAWRDAVLVVNPAAHRELLRAMNVQVWSDEAEQRFVNAVRRYLTTEAAPDANSSPIFAAMADALRDTYAAEINAGRDVALPDSVREVLDGILGKSPDAEIGGGLAADRILAVPPEMPMEFHTKLRPRVESMVRLISDQNAWLGGRESKAMKQRLVAAAHVVIERVRASQSPTAQMAIDAAEKAGNIAEEEASILRRLMASASLDQAIDAINADRIKQGVRPFRWEGDVARPSQYAWQAPPVIGADVVNAVAAVLPPKTRAKLLPFIQPALEYLRMDALPDEPYSREKLITDAIEVAVEMQQARTKSAKLKGKLGNAAARNLRLNVQSRRYAIADVSLASQRLRLAEADDANLRKAVAGDTAVHNRFTEMLKTARMNMKKRLWLLGNKARRDAFITALTTNPDDPKSQDVLQDAAGKLAYGKTPFFDAAGKLNVENPVAHLLQLCIDEFQGPSALNVRFLQCMRWFDLYDAYVQHPDKIGEQNVRNALPWHWNPETGKAERVSAEEMVKARRAWVAGGDSALVSHLGSVAWGTRRHYYMTRADFEVALESSGGDVMPLFQSPSNTDALAKPSEINSRMGIANYKEGDPLSLIFRHMRNLEVRRRTWSEARAVLDELKILRESEEIGHSLYDGLLQGTRNIWGEPQQSKPFTRFFRQANALFWTRYAISPHTAAWYGARNTLTQGQPFGVVATQFDMKDILNATAIIPSLLVDEGSPLRLALAEDWSESIAQSHERVHQAILHRGAEETDIGGPTKLRESKWANEAQSWMREAIGKLAYNSLAWSDGGNRIYGYSVAYITGDKYLRAFADGDMEQGDLEHHLRFSSLTPFQRGQLRQMLRTAKENGDGSRESYEHYLREWAKIKTLNTNFDYRTIGRGAYEQTDWQRMLAGLLVFPRGKVEILQQGVIRPWAQTWAAWKATGFKPGGLDVDRVSEAWKTLFWYLMGSWMTEVGQSYIMGTKRDKRGKAIRAHDPVQAMIPNTGGQPGVSVASHLLNTLSDVMPAILYGDEDALSTILKEVDRRVLIPIIPMYSELEVVLNSWYGTAGERRLSTLVNVMRDRLDLVNIDEVDRSWLEAIHYAMFDTDRVPQDEWTLEERVKWAAPWPVRGLLNQGEE